MSVNNKVSNKYKIKNKNKHKNRHKNSNKKTRKFKQSNCAPSPSNNYTCYSDKSLYKLRDFWNIRHPDVKIISDDTKYIWEQLKKNMLNVCDTERCWLRQKFIANNMDSTLLTYTFAPDSPPTWKTNINEWLSSIDIENVMKQYENKFSNFVFIGPSPIDFDTHIEQDECVWDELCKFNLNTYLQNGKNKIGMIFNTDTHDKDGSHWVSMFIDIKKKFIFYFDSNGNKPQKEIIILQNRIKQQGKMLGIDFIIDSNYPKEHQKSSTECGMYSLYFISNLIKDEKMPNFFKTHTILDCTMENLRTKYFNQ
jgi:hypothetical protein